MNATTATAMSLAIQDILGEDQTPRVRFYGIGPGPYPVTIHIATVEFDSPITADAEARARVMGIKGGWADIYIGEELIRTVRESPLAERRWEPDPTINHNPVRTRYLPGDGGTSAL